MTEVRVLCIPLGINDGGGRRAAGGVLPEATASEVDQGVSRSVELINTMRTVAVEENYTEGENNKP